MAAGITTQLGRSLIAMGLRISVAKIELAIKDAFDTNELHIESS